AHRPNSKRASRGALLRKTCGNSRRRGASRRSTNCGRNSSSCSRFPRVKLGRGAEASGSGSKDCGRIEVCPPNIHTCFPPFPFFRPYILTFCC
uniref:Uncharacterized protein n=1 Tax=Tetraodon nigroviridis TaxID=99883 RepID=H3BZ81_TETNG